ncbi:Werner syndrome ATP-dependent helicase [Cytospora mali]|uniref:Werner syndrome ATP-dependent helicase n=1 Tax=Cytospora mali TaxID=578113 RepID=A0A194VTT9_CYTMA|nr:Werner syndrome ATP-dependent helicase [Valsa mali]
MTGRLLPRLAGHGRVLAADLMAKSGVGKAIWPLPFQLSLSLSTIDHQPFWSHTLYRGPYDQQVQVLYSRTRLESEEVASEFVNEKVLGFDMEWPWPWPADSDPNAALQHRIGLIQLACEDKIALFHIGLHSGNTPNDLLAPSLRRIIESPDISKCGVAIQSADFLRLQKWFGLKPRGAVELSHLHNLITYGASDPSKCTRKLRSLAYQVEEHLGLPLHKGKVRTSNWSEPLDQEQIHYAAADAYAGFMLYYCMDAKRVSMQPVPPLPVYAETYLPVHPDLGKKMPLQLRPVDDEGEVIIARDFFKPKAVDVAEADLSPLEDDAELEGLVGAQTVEGHGEEARETDNQPLPSTSKEILELVQIGRRGRHIIFARAEDIDSNVVDKLRAQHAAGQEKGHSEGWPGPAPNKVRRDDPRKELGAKAVPKTAKADTIEQEPHSRLLDEGREEALFQRLRAHRTKLAHERKCAPFIIAHDTHLHAMSRQCPRKDTELLRIKGIGKRKLADFGQGWLAIINGFVAESDFGKSSSAVQDDKLSNASLQSASQLKSNAPNVDQAEGTTSADSVQTPPMLHTGISFSLGQATLADGTMEDVFDDEGLEGADDLEDISAFGSQIRSPGPSLLKRKREQTEAAEEPAASARPGMPTGSPPPLLSDTRQKAAEQRSVTGAAGQDPQVIVTTEAGPSPRQSISMIGPTHSLSRSGPPSLDPASPGAQAAQAVQAAPPILPQSQEFSTATPLRSVTPAANQHLEKNARKLHTGATPRPVSQSTEARGELHIFRNKLAAFNKLVTAAIRLSPATIEHIVTKPPKTMEDLLRIPGVMPFANACSRANRDFLGFIIKSTPKRGLGQT